MTVLLGAIADDLTGATDLANTLVQNGVRVAQVIGVPDGNIDIGEAQAVVIALKSRTLPVAKAVHQSLQALEWLRAQNVRQILFKYCSTFDSTEKGNIGPVTEALLDRLDVDFTLICPAFPANGRRVFQGHLFVDDMLLSDSPMKDHPLTPMRDASVIRLMQAQSQWPVGLIPLSDVIAGPQAIARKIDELRAQGIRHGVIDAICDDDLHVIGQAAASHRLITGGSAVAMGLPENLRKAGLLGMSQPPVIPASKGRSVVLAGSCSAATRRQIEHVTKKWPTQKLQVDRIAQGHNITSEVVDWAVRQPDDTPVLIYGSADPAEVLRMQQLFGKDVAGRMMENALGKIAVALRAKGFGRYVVAGGETSGAVVASLGISALGIGPEITPGVPWTHTIGQDGLALALKSGNFGQDDFFLRAFKQIEQ